MRAVKNRPYSVFRRTSRRGRPAGGPWVGKGRKPRAARSTAPTVIRAASVFLSRRNRRWAENLNQTSTQCPSGAGRGFLRGGRLEGGVGGFRQQRKFDRLHGQRLPLSRFFGDFLGGARKLPAGGSRSAIRDNVGARERRFTVGAIINRPTVQSHGFIRCAGHPPMRAVKNRPYSVFRRNPRRGRPAGGPEARKRRQPRAAHSTAPTVWFEECSRRGRPAGGPEAGKRTQPRAAHSTAPTVEVDERPP